MARMKVDKPRTLHLKDKTKPRPPVTPTKERLTREVAAPAAVDTIDNKRMESY